MGKGSRGFLAERMGWFSRGPLAVTMLAVSTQGCASSLAVRSGGHCDPPVVLAPHLPADPPPAESAPREARLAALLGLSDAYQSRQAGNEGSMEARMRVLERIELARLSIAATSAELDCEGERADQTADYLGHRTTSAVQTLTVASIVTGAVTAIAGVFLSTKNANATTQDTVAIPGGALTAGLGIASLSLHPHIDYAHPRNPLADIWRGPDVTRIFPPIVWAYLTHREFSNDQQQSIREKIVLRWRRYQGVERDAGDVTLLFGEGGSYDADLLRTRSQMLDEVKAEVDLASQDLEALMSELVQ